MKFLADESCPGPVIRALRDARHDVVAIAEIAAGASDEQVLDRALAEGRVLITEDRDFGNLVYARGRRSPGVILLRFPNNARQARPATLLEAIIVLGPRLQNAFTVVEPAGCASPRTRNRKSASPRAVALSPSVLPTEATEGPEPVGIEDSGLAG